MRQKTGISIIYVRPYVVIIVPGCVINDFCRFNVLEEYIGRFHAENGKSELCVKLRIHFSEFIGMQNPY